MITSVLPVFEVSTKTGIGQIAHDRPGVTLRSPPVNVKRPDGALKDRALSGRVLIRGVMFYSEDSGMCAVYIDNPWGKVDKLRRRM